MSTPRNAHTPDAIDLLKADHQQVMSWFTEFQDCRTLGREEELAALICEAIRRHANFDASVFYPAFLAATGDDYRFQAMLSEERDINDLIDEIEGSGPSEDSFFAKLHLLCAMFEHHVRQEEKERGIFTEAIDSGLDVKTLGREFEEDRTTPARRLH